MTFATLINFDRNVRAGHGSEYLAHRPDSFHGVGYHDRPDGRQPTVIPRDEQIAKFVLNSPKPSQSYTSTESNI